MNFQEILKDLLQLIHGILYRTFSQVTSWLPTQCQTPLKQKSLGKTNDKNLPETSKPIKNNMADFTYPAEAFT